MSRTRIPIFPLPDVVLFPNVLLPLHVFELRYKDMVRDVLAGDRIIGMVLLRNGWKEHANDTPPVYAVGCAGFITRVERLVDGRYNIVLRGLEKFRIQDEEHSLAYRVAHIESITEPEDTSHLDQLRAGRTQLENLLERRLAATGSTPLVPREMSDCDLVNTLAQYLEFEPVEKQALLQCNGLLARCRTLIELIEMRLLLADHSFQPSGVQ